MRVTQFVSICEQTAAIYIDDDSCHKAVAHEFQRERSDVFGAANASHKGAFCRSCEHFRTPVGGHSGIDGRISYAGRNHINPNGRKFDGKGPPQRFNRCVDGRKTCQPRRGTAAQSSRKKRDGALERICA
jgi:hypothetical protein